MKYLALILLLFLTGCASNVAYQLEEIRKSMLVDRSRVTKVERELSKVINLIPPPVEVVPPPEVIIIENPQLVAMDAKLDEAMGYVRSVVKYVSTGGAVTGAGLGLFWWSGAKIPRRKRKPNGNDEV